MTKPKDDGARIALVRTADGFIERFLDDDDKNHCCRVLVQWMPEGKTKFVSWEFEQDNDDLYLEEAAKVSWLLNNPDGFLKECAPPNVTKADITAARDILTHILYALQWGAPTDLDELGSMVECLNTDAKGDRKKRQFVDEVKDFAIKVQAAPVDRQDECVKKLGSHIAYWHLGWVLKKLDPAMVKQDVVLIDPHSTGGRGKKGPVWLAARLIAAANAGDDFELPRANESDDDYIKYVSGALATARTPARGKPKASAKKT